MDQAKFERAKAISRELETIKIELFTWKEIEANTKNFPVPIRIGPNDSVTISELEFEGLFGMCVATLNSREKDLQDEFDKL